MNRRASVLLVYAGAALGFAAATGIATSPTLAGSTLERPDGGADTSIVAQVNQVTLVPVKDNTLYEDGEGDVSNGSGAHLFVGNSNHSVIRRAVMEFDVAPNIPTGSKILTATLSINMSKTSSQDQPVTLHTVAAEWGEGGSNADRNEGSGARAQDGDATWLHTFFPNDRWSNAGGDYSQAPSAAATVGAVGAYVWHSEQMAADVQAWLDDPDGNHGWMMIGREREGQNKVRRTSKRFNSREFTSDAPSPKLVVEFSNDSSTPPIPTPDTPTPDTPTPETPTVETPTVETPTVETPTVETPTAETPTGDVFVYLPITRNG